MLQNILSIICIIIFSLFPLILWMYGTTFLSAHSWNRRRFLIGILGGWCTVWLIALFSSFFRENLFFQILTTLGIFLIIWLGVVIFTQYGSVYIRTFIRKIIGLHILLIAVSLLVYYGVSLLFPVTPISLAIFSGMSSILITASMEEWVKHLSSVGLSSREFRFSRKDFLIFTLFITLGFVFFENSIYLIWAIPRWVWAVIWTGITRSIFSLSLHVFAASICIVFWWRALSYWVFSWQYSALFLIGFILATTVHGIFNIAIQEWYTFVVIILAILSYVFFTQWLLEEDEKV